ncbi:hypothetical protein KPSA3_02477 [Pseudomonas syringae pv. actinidiae]|uniref:Uncharacterized protein n=1 Tax=Pseudomonas syringae pv. actinidiae TaxID=103796 RepID=A0AAN4Q345_PSESF|nr:hypothetical protein KPSA3_02477 [Pseudomonas syringae pv. actinidiae]
MTPSNDLHPVGKLGLYAALIPSWKHPKNINAQAHPALPIGYPAPETSLLRQ